MCPQGAGGSLCGEQHLVFEVRTVSECSLLFQHKVTFDPTSSYTLEDLKPDTLYRFQLAARSDMGVGVFTPTIEARTAQSSKCLLRPLPVTSCWGAHNTHTLPS